ncbi:hypothetical protein PIROE2DRAFT_14491, partial [Piromyces sp. E2]
SFYCGYELVDSILYKQYINYSPYSVNNALKEDKIENNQVDNYSEFSKFVQKNFDKLRDVIISLIKLERIKISTLMYKNDMIATFNERKNNLITLVHLGYLSYNSNTEEIFIPNQENLQIFELFSRSKTWEILKVKSKNKTELILRLNEKVNIKNENYVCITRPRRFGKTVTADMVTAYYSYTESRINAFDGKKLVENDNWDKYFGKFNVIKLNMIDFFSIITKDKEIELIDIDEGIEKIKESIVNEVQNIVPNFKYKNKYDVEQILSQIEKDTGHKQYIALVYMTGILPIKKYGNNSNLASIFEELSMTSPRWMAKYIGFTDEDIKKLLFCKKYINNQTKIDNVLNNKNLNEIKFDEKILEEYKEIKKWYNGYQQLLD